MTKNGNNDGKIAVIQIFKEKLIVIKGRDGNKFIIISKVVSV